MHEGLPRINPPHKHIEYQSSYPRSSACCHLDVHLHVLSSLPRCKVLGRISSRLSIIWCPSHISFSTAIHFLHVYGDAVYFFGVSTQGDGIASGGVSLSYSTRMRKVRVFGRSSVRRLLRTDSTVHFFKSLKEA